MISANSRIPSTSGVTRRALMTIQPMLSDTAAATSTTHSATKNAIAFCRRVTGELYGRGKGDRGKGDWGRGEGGKGEGLWQAIGDRGQGTEDRSPTNTDDRGEKTLK